MKVSTSIEDLCLGYPTEFASYLHYCRSLGFADEPDYAYLKRIFLFIHEGFQSGYVIDWTILRSQQAQIATPPSQTLASGITSLFSSYKLHLNLTMVALFRALVPDPSQTFLQPFAMLKTIQVKKDDYQQILFEGVLLGHS